MTGKDLLKAAKERFRSKFEEEPTNIYAVYISGKKSKPRKKKLGKSSCPLSIVLKQEKKDSDVNVEFIIV